MGHVGDSKQASRQEWCSFFLEIELSCESGAILQYKQQPQPTTASHRQPAQRPRKRRIKYCITNCTQYIKDTNLESEQT